MNPDARRTIKAQADGSGAMVTDGTRTVTVEDENRGIILSTSISDIASGLLTSSETSSGFDEQDRPTLITYHDGTTIQRVYGCCGLTSETDREGVTSTFTYDALSRQVSETRDGVTTTQGLDALGRVTREVLRFPRFCGLGCDKGAESPKNPIQLLLFLL